MVMIYTASNVEDSGERMQRVEAGGEMRLHINIRQKTSVNTALGIISIFLGDGRYPCTTPFLKITFANKAISLVATTAKACLALS